MTDKYNQAFNSLVLMLSGGLRKEYLENETIKNDLETLKELLDICSKQNVIKYKLDHIQQVIIDCYEIDDEEWKREVELTEQELTDISLAYSIRVEDSRIVNELQELLDCMPDNIVKHVKELKENSNDKNN